MPLLVKTQLSPEQQQELLLNLDAVLPSRMTTWDIQLVVSYICHRYSLPTSAGVRLFAHVLDTMADQERAQGPRSDREIN
jgi:hypothetical protein